MKCSRKWFEFGTWWKCDNEATQQVPEKNGKHLCDHHAKNARRRLRDKTKKRLARVKQ